MGIRWSRRNQSQACLDRRGRKPDSAGRIRSANQKFPGEAFPVMTKEVLITTSPFAEVDRTALRLLDAEGIRFALNPFGRRLREEELADLIGPYETMIAGTEPITAAVLDRAPNLRLIAHTGIGLDNIPLNAARARNIAVTYTPSAPSPAVAELVIGQMLTLLRG